MRKIITVFGMVIFGFSNLYSQPSNSEIYLFSIDLKDGKYVFSGGMNISNNAGYDNQPSFTLDNKSVLFTSNRRSNNFDIFEYDLKSGKITGVITSEAGEYTAKELDSITVAFVREGNAQEMTVWKYDRRTKVEKRAFSVKEPVAYYAFNNKNDSLVWVRYAHMMRSINAGKSINEYVANYAQPSVPHLIPGTDKFSFVVRHPDDSLWIKEFDAMTRAVRPIVQPKDGKIDYCWMTDGSMLIGSGSKLYRFDEKNDKDWKLVADLKKFGILDISRMAASSDGKQLALVNNQR